MGNSKELDGRMKDWYTILSRCRLVMHFPGVFPFVFFHLCFALCLSLSPRELV